ncbi:MAG: hypothetical protein QG657_711 [Acidobacteriota bacterium]|nr:hypothetical protein [Acidobacteriota bacterium]
MEINYHELIDLIHIPEINLELAASLEEWENKEEIAAINTEFDARWAHYFDILFISPLQRAAEGKDYRSKMRNWLWFELTRTDDWTWDQKWVFPDAIYNFPCRDILPADIIDRVTDTLVDPDRVVTMKGVRSKFLDISVDLQVVHFSNTYIFGTIKNSARWKPFDRRDPEMELKMLLAIKQFAPEEFTQDIKEFLTWFPPVVLTRHKRRGHLDLVDLPLINKNNPLDELKYFPLNQGNEMADCRLLRLLKMRKLPGVNERLMLKWCEIKEGSHKNAIEAYKIDKEGLYQLMYTKRNKNRKSAKGAPPLYWFELTAVVPDRWMITNLTPAPTLFEPVEDILPMEFLNLVHFAEPDGKMVKCTYEFKKPAWRKLDIWWTRYSTNCVMGSVCESTEDLDEVQASYDRLLKGNIDIDSRHLYRLFVYHFRTQPEVVRYFLRGCENNPKTPIIRNRV